MTRASAPKSWRSTRDGPSDGTILLDLDPDLGGDVEEPTTRTTRPT